MLATPVTGYTAGEVVPPVSAIVSVVPSSVTSKDVVPVETPTVWVRVRVPFAYCAKNDDGLTRSSSCSSRILVRFCNFIAVTSQLSDGLDPPPPGWRAPTAAPPRVRWQEFASA